MFFIQVEQVALREEFGNIKVRKSRVLPVSIILTNWYIMKNLIMNMRQCLEKNKLKGGQEQKKKH